ncbi:hypothetical protein [Flavobacterium undicola]|uniref:hypothetical protein n=1 Tax=Flavobacterium undicola TaxID=1932779 RepID=UPI00137828DC|nr:hypothetical protein [Flavobacterium undicola]MBA0883329.1 hypothetical protein [Flavobacterium undicola]
METPISPLIVISFFIQSCHTYAAIDSKDTPLFTGKNFIVNQILLFETTKLLSVNDSSLIVSKYNIQKTTLISEIKTENKTFLKEVEFIISFELPITIPIETLNSDFVFDDFTFSKN